MRAVRFWPALVLAVLVTLAAASLHAQGDDGEVPGLPVAQPQAYRPGPLEQRPPPETLAWPSGVEEALALGVLAAILLGLRASGLARHDAGGPTRTPPRGRHTAG